MAPLLNEVAASSLSKFWAIRHCESLKSPAIFSAWEDCSFYLDADENDGDVTFQAFNELCDAIAYAFPGVAYTTSDSNSGSTIKNDSRDDASVQHGRSQPFNTSQVPQPGRQIGNSTCGVITNKNDVFCGRGGFVNHNPGNKQFRTIVSRNKQEYTEAGRESKHEIAERIVNKIRELDPPGRFLRSTENGVWFDIGDARAIGKTKQALREFDAPVRADQGSSPSPETVSHSKHAEELSKKASASSEAKYPHWNYQMEEGRFSDASTPDKATAPVKLEDSPSVQGDEKDTKPPLGQLTNFILPLTKTSTSVDEEAASYGYRRCVPLQGPVPPFFQGKVAKHVTLPYFHALANFRDLAPGCCTMCGEARPKKGTPGAGEAVIPTQNKGVCTACDVKVWVVRDSSLQIKWCKGCKNFRLWASFGEKGHTTKCMPCREYQAKRYLRKKSLEGAGTRVV